VADLFTGMYATTAILAALRHRDLTGVGQAIDMALLDTQVAMLANLGANYLTTGVAPQRVGNAHQNIVPYQVFEVADGHMIVAVGNDGQFAKFCEVAGRREWASDPRFARNADRVRNRATLVPMIAEVVRARTQRDWLDALESVGVPCGPINTLDRVFADPHVVAHAMRRDLAHPLAGSVPQVGVPIGMSATPPGSDEAPPLLGQHTREVLRERLALDDAEIDRLSRSGVIGIA
jgi:crotonobetainyl-CoA:carnitine CoA-transferase CaiB-like acyl-CoA transferase